MDVICLQEVWRTDIQRLIFSELRDLYPHTISQINLTTPKSPPAAACRGDQIQAYAGCLQQNCASNPSIACPIEDCITELLSVSYECRYCMIFNLDPNNPLGIFNCAQHPESYYERSFGLMMLSRKPTSQVQVDGYLGEDSDLRGYIKATVSNHRAGGPGGPWPPQNFRWSYLAPPEF